MVKIGFKVQKGKKRRCIPGHEAFKNKEDFNEDVEEREYVHGNFDSLKSVPQSMEEMVIPLSIPSWQKVSLEDEEAANAIVNELKKEKTKEKKDEPVIPLPSNLFRPSERKEEDDQKKKKSILQQQVFPGMEKLRSESDKLKLELSFRPTENNVTSDKYEKVPVSAFGAAMLRGMGWKGKIDEKDETIQPRGRRVGLGAAAKPPEMIKKSKHKKRRRPDRP